VVGRAKSVVLMEVKDIKKKNQGKGDALFK
jgi:hypothetical protein